MRGAALVVAPQLLTLRFDERARVARRTAYRDHKLAGGLLHEFRKGAADARIFASIHAPIWDYGEPISTLRD